jgi:SAM-dependent methyltransferase
MQSLKSLIRILRRPGAYARFQRDYRAFQQMHKKTDSPPNLSPIISAPRVLDFDANHPIPQSVYEVSAAASYIAKKRPQMVHDIGSNIHYLSVLSSFVPVVSYEVRQVSLSKDGFQSLTGDARQLPFSDNSIEFFTSLCVMEHIGLGRYGDPLDPDGDVKFASEIVRCLKPGGTLILSVPIGPEVICFNANRVYSKEKMLTLFKGLQLQEESYIGSNGFAPYNEPTFGHYHIGVFCFTK